MLQTPAKMEELVLLESTLSLVTALLVTLENCVRQILMSVLLTPAKMEELVLMESIVQLVIALLVTLENCVRQILMSVLLTPAKMEELVLMESIVQLVIALLVTLENCVRQILMSVLQTPAKMEELVLMELILLLAIVLLVILEPYVMLQVCPLANRSYFTVDIVSTRARAEAIPYAIICFSIFMHAPTFFLAHRMYVGTYPLPECITRAINPKYHSSQCWLLCMFHSIMEYGSTPYVGMARGKMAATSNVLCGCPKM